MGIDLSDRAVAWTREGMRAFGFEPHVGVADAERLPFPDGSFDLVYSWGVLHHTPDTGASIREVLRVLRPGGEAKIMIYHKYSITGYMLWLRYALLRGRPGRTLSNIYAHHLESPGTRAFSLRQAREFFSAFREVRMRVRLGFGDLLCGEVGQRHRGILLAVAKKCWPRTVIKKLFKRYGLYILVHSIK